MTKLTKRTGDAADVREKDDFIWDDELPGVGLRVFASGKRSYLIQYRAAGRTRRYTIGLHGVWTPETARQEAKVQLGSVARGDNPPEERQLDYKAITVKELCALYIADLNAGLILGKGGRPKKPTTIMTDTGRISCRAPWIVDASLSSWCSMDTPARGSWFWVGRAGPCSPT
jgi:hypothetical protein